MCIRIKNLKSGVLNLVIYVSCSITTSTCMQLNLNRKYKVCCMLCFGLNLLLACISYFFFALVEKGPCKYEKIDGKSKFQQLCMCLYFCLCLVDSAQSSTHYIRYLVLHEGHWGADFQSTITRKLINKTHGNKIILLFVHTYIHTHIHT